MYNNLIKTSNLGGIALSGDNLPTFHPITSISSPSYVIGPSKQSATIGRWPKLNSRFGSQFNSSASFIHRRAGRISRSPSPERSTAVLSSKPGIQSDLNATTFLTTKFEKGNTNCKNITRSNSLELISRRLSTHALINERGSLEENKELKKQISELKESILRKEEENKKLRLKLDFFHKEIQRYSSISFPYRESLPPLKVRARNANTNVNELKHDPIVLSVTGDFSGEDGCFFSKKRCIWKPNEAFAKDIMLQMKISFLCTKGKRMNKSMVNQDDFCIVKFSNECIVIGVFDGHGRYGHKVAAIVRQKVIRGLQNIFSEDFKIGNFNHKSLDAASMDLNKFESSESYRNINTEIINLFNDIQQILDREGSFGTSGTSATVSIINCDRVVMIQLGNSVGTIFNSKINRIIYNTPKHDAGNSLEMERLLSRGVTIDADRRFYMKCNENKSFSITRSLGDTDGREAGILNQPEIWEIKRERGDSLVVMLATDGFQKYPCDKSIDFKKLTVQEELENAVRKCQDNWLKSTNGTSVDDITVISLDISN
ncbi:Pp2c protein phosphatase 2C [Cryptosporidium felis]|nr:Pp2c protein phosphatase 2C [Cryptosporidium felis]